MSRAAWEGNCHQASAEKKDIRVRLLDPALLSGFLISKGAKSRKTLEKAVIIGKFQDTHKTSYC